MTTSTMTNKFTDSQTRLTVEKEGLCYDIQDTFSHPCPTIHTLQPSFMQGECSNTGGRGTVPPGHMLNSSSNRADVPKKDGVQRPVINLKHLNKFVKSEHFRMEGLHTVNALIRRNDWVAKVDLKDTLIMVPIAPTKILKSSVEMLRFDKQLQG